MDFKILDDSCLVHSFRCRDKFFVNYLKKHAKKDMANKLTKVYVHTCHENSVLAYYALSAYLIEKTNPRTKEVFGLEPAILITRLAKHRSLDKGTGQKIIKNAVKIAIEVSEKIGVSALVVEAKNDKLKEWYKELGFDPIPFDKDKKMYKSLANLS